MFFSIIIFLNNIYPFPRFYPIHKSYPIPRSFPVPSYTVAYLSVQPALSPDSASFLTVLISNVYPLFTYSLLDMSMPIEPISNYTVHTAYMYSMYCSLSLWRVARGSKHMFLELIHGLFIT
jgi:hypothetical protein